MEAVGGLILGSLFSLSLLWTYLASIPFLYRSIQAPPETLALLAALLLLGAWARPIFTGAFALATSLGALVTFLFAFIWGEPAWTLPMLGLIGASMLAQAVTVYRLRHPPGDPDRSE